MPADMFGVLFGILLIISGVVSVSNPAGGVVSVLAGVTFLFAPAFAVSVFLTFAAILLIVVGIGILLTFPPTMSTTTP